MDKLAETMTALVAGIKPLFGLFSEFPFNVFLGIGIAAGGFKLFKQAKRAAK